MHPESVQKGTFSVVLPENTLKQHYFWKKRALFCQILQGAASDYQTMISFGLFLGKISGSQYLWPDRCQNILR